MAEHNHKDEVTGVDTTGHEWDGIRELDNPLPRWWLWIFYACVAWSVVYMIFMPALPAPPGFEGFTRGLTGNSERANVAQQMADLQASRSTNFDRLQNADFQAIESDPELFRFAIAAGRSAFGDNCATCHGSGGGGAVGYPNLNDDIWLWGGTFDDIRYTLHVGIRSDHPDTRFSQMPAFGRDELLSQAEIRDVTQYVLQLSGQSFDAAAADRGAATFQNQCVSCHMEDGTGDQAQGAPNLTDRDWLYGGSAEQIEATIHRGPYGVMPSWEGRLSEPMITALATYVYSLGGGQEAGGDQTGAGGE